MSRYGASAASLALGAALAAVAFGARGGTELTRATTTEAILVLGAAGVVCLALLYGHGRPWGAATLGLLAVLTALTALSIGWSVAPHLSYQDTGRMLAYLAVFAAAVSAPRLAPRAAPVVVRGVLIAVAAVVAYGLAARVWPGSIGENEISARLGQPFDYWNALGTTAALAVPPALWLGARRAGREAASVLAYPLLGLLIVAIFLTQSRGALAAAVVGAALWLLMDPARLRSLLVIVVSSAGAAPVIAWALSRDAFQKGLQPPAVREAVAGDFGLLLLGMCVLLAAAGVALTFGARGRAPSLRTRKRIGFAAAAAACLVPLVVLTSVAFSQRGLGGTISDRFDTLTSDTAQTPGGSARLTTTSSTRSRYWGQAWDVFSDDPLAGTGAGSFAVSHLRFREGETPFRQAHGYLPQTLADLGLLGILASLALLAAWLAAAGRTLAVPRRGRAVAPGAERAALTALGLAPVAYGVQSAIDWTWMVPGPTVMALVAAGFVAARGPLAAGVPEPPEPPPELRRRPGALRMAAAAGVLVIAVLCAWAIREPERSDRASDEAFELVQRNDLEGASEKAREAYDLDPLSPEPLFTVAFVETARGRNGRAYSALRRAVVEHPADPQAWMRLARFQLDTLDRPDLALETMEGARYLDPYSRTGNLLFRRAEDALARDRVARLRDATQLERERVRETREEAAG